MQEMANKALFQLDTVWCKILMEENIDKFDEFPTIRQYFPYQILH